VEKYVDAASVKAACAEGRDVGRPVPLLLPGAFARIPTASDAEDRRVLMDASIELRSAIRSAAVSVGFVAFFWPSLSAIAYDKYARSRQM